MDKFIEAIVKAAQEPLAVVALCIMFVTWVVVLSRKNRLDFLRLSLQALPERDRLRAIAKEYGTEPKAGVNAEQWLRARRQLLLLAAYVATLFFVVSLAVTMQRKRQLELPGGSNQAAMVKHYAELQKKLELFSLRAEDVVAAFEQVGKSAYESDDDYREITDAITRYNEVITDLRTHRHEYERSVTVHLQDPQLREEVRSLLNFALTRIHDGEILQLNEVRIKIHEISRKRKTLASGEPAQREKLAAELEEMRQKTDRLLEERVRQANQVVPALRERAANLFNRLDPQGTHGVS